MALAFKQQNSYSLDDLLECGHGRLFGPGNAQLPLPPMLMFDRITHISDDGGNYGKGEIVAELDVKPDLWFFNCHFTNLSACHTPVFDNSCKVSCPYCPVSFCIKTTQGAIKTRMTELM